MCLARERFEPWVKEMEGAIAEAERVAKVPHRRLPAGLPAALDVKVFAKARYASVLAQLAGKEEGYLPYWQKGFIGGRMKRPATGPATRESGKGG
jgi:hypothetical protein